MMPEDAQTRITEAAPDSCTVTRYIGGLESHAAAADVVVCMAGYNTSCEVLGARTPTVMMPRTTQREEQRIRATMLAKHGLVDMVDVRDASTADVADAVRRALARGRRTDDGGLALDGHSRVATEVARIVPVRTIPQALPSLVERKISA
jgi:predicted glycosyltransferase